MLPWIKYITFAVCLYFFTNFSFQIYLSTAENRALPRCKKQWNSPVTWNKENEEVNIIDPNPNNSSKTKKNFTGSYAEVNPKTGTKTESCGNSLTLDMSE